MTPEEQFDLYKFIRDGDVLNVKRILLERSDPLPVDFRPFESLWHEPGPDATPLHLAACCIQPSLVAWLLENGADPNLKAHDKTAFEMIDLFELFAPARLTRPDDRLAVIKLLTPSE